MIGRLLSFETYVIAAISLLVAIFILYIYDKHILKLQKFQMILLLNLLFLGYAFVGNKRANFYSS